MGSFWRLMRDLEVAYNGVRWKWHEIDWEQMGASAERLERIAAQIKVAARIVAKNEQSDSASGAREGEAG